MSSGLDPDFFAMRVMSRDFSDVPTTSSARPTSYGISVEAGEQPAWRLGPRIVMLLLTERRLLTARTGTVEGGLVLGYWADQRSSNSKRRSTPWQARPHRAATVEIKCGSVLTGTDSAMLNRYRPRDAEIDFEAQQVMLWLSRDRNAARAVRRLRA